MIYRLFLQGKTAAGICKHLMKQGIPTPAGKTKWSQSTVMSILQNEKYKGDGCISRFTLESAENMVYYSCRNCLYSQIMEFILRKGKQHEETNFMFGIGNGDDLHLTADECLCGGCCSKRHLR